MKILIAEDNCLYLEGLHYLVQAIYPEAHIGEVINGADALKLITSGNALDLAIIDLKLPCIDGFTLLKQLSIVGSLVPVLIISSSEDPDDMEKAFSLGARAYISKSFNSNDLRSVLNSIVSTNINDTRKITKLKENRSWGELHHITPRQLEVLRLVKKGKHNSEIAEKLFISERTVKAHLAALFESFDTKSRTELIHRVDQLGLD